MDPAKNQDNDTQGTEQCSFYDSIISTCGCGGNSIEETNSMREKGIVETQDPPPKPQVVHEFDETPKLWERLSDVAQFLIGGAPPVKFVRCFECSSVDESVITMPRALGDLANEYDERNKNSMMGISESTTGEDFALYDADNIYKSRSKTGSRWGRIKRSRSSRSHHSGPVSDTYLSKMKMKGWSGKSRADTKSRSTKMSRRSRSMKVEI